MRRLALACGVTLLAGAALAQDAAPLPVPEEFVRLFSSYCLQKFPDDDALVQLATKDKLEPLSPAQVRTIVRKDAGIGWVTGEYMLTVEPLPLHTCALRRTSEKALDGQPLMAAAKSFAEAGGHKLLPPVGFARPMGRGVISNSMTLQELDEKDQPLPQAYMFYVVSYPPTPRADGTVAKAFYEVRFARQMYRQQT
ncbi:MAG: hypothetical protein ABI608_04695 [Rhizomicrobium sp.]